MFRKRKYKAIVIGGSAGSFQVVTKILANLPMPLSVPIFLCFHRLKHVRGGFTEALNIKSIIPVHEPGDKEKIVPGRIYLAPSNYHMYIELGNTIALSTEELVNHSRPAIDLCFESAAYVYNDALIGILLSGANKDGALGMKKIKENGGLTIIQSPESSQVSTMPASAEKLTTIDHKLSVEELTAILGKLIL